ncbi:MAG: acyl-CoA dehydrogenase family protein [Actinobacteria bacterium]|nr:acyl-CoA dehydrogenase family protein [Actinomycetota bacterium]
MVALTQQSALDDEILDGLRAFLAAEVVARHERHADLLESPHRVHDATGRYTPEVEQLMREVRTASAEAGYYLMLAPESMGGAALGHEALFLAWETIFRECGAKYWLGWYAVAHWTKGPSPLLEHLSPAVRDRHLPAIVSGERTTCFAMSEPDAGSDAWMMRTRAVPIPGGWRLDGEKQWISNAAHADLAIVFAVTDVEAAAARRGGITAFAVPTDTPGFDVFSVTRMFGQAGGHEGIVQLAGVEVPDDHVLGEVGDGFRLALLGVSLGRLYNAAKGVGLARWALEKALAYVQERETFGKRVAEYQGITFPLAESAMEVHAARLVGLDCARKLDAGLPARMELAMAKAYATEAGARAVDRAMQAHGAMGFTNELALAEAWQALRSVLVADGSSEILRRTILKQLLDGEREL